MSLIPRYNNLTRLVISSACPVSIHTFQFSDPIKDLALWDLRSLDQHTTSKKIQGLVLLSFPLSPFFSLKLQSCKVYFLVSFSVATTISVVSTYSINCIVAMCSSGLGTTITSRRYRIRAWLMARRYRSCVALHEKYTLVLIRNHTLFVDPW